MGANWAVDDGICSICGNEAEDTSLHIHQLHADTERVRELEAERDALSVNRCNGPCEIDKLELYLSICVWAMKNASNYYVSLPDGGSYYANKSLKIEILRRLGKLPKGAMSTDKDIETAEKDITDGGVL